MRSGRADRALHIHGRLDLFRLALYNAITQAGVESDTIEIDSGKNAAAAETPPAR